MKWAIPGILVGNLTHTLFWDIQSVQAFSLSFAIVLALEDRSRYPFARGKNDAQERMILGAPRATSHCKLREDPKHEGRDH